MPAPKQRKARRDAAAPGAHAAVTGQGSELGRLLLQRLAQQGLPASAPPRVQFNLAGQQANSLLHDGHAWKDGARSARDGARRAMRAQADLLVHASFAFLAVLPPKDPLRSLAQVLLDIEQQVLAGATPACVLRLGYLYGPGSHDLRAYRSAFKLGRPYWAGAPKAGQFHLHHDDAVSALLTAAAARHTGKTCYATSGECVPFMPFMDHFARRLGKRVILHAPRLAAPVFKLVVCTEHMQQVELAMPADGARPTLPGWHPQWPDHRAALDRIVSDWET